MKNPALSNADFFLIFIKSFPYYKRNQQSVTLSKI